MRTVNEKLCDESIAHALFLSRYSNYTANRMVKILNKSDADLTARLLVALDDLNPSSFTVRLLESKLASVREVNRLAVSAMESVLLDELSIFSGYETGFQYELFELLLPDAVLRKYSLARVTEEQVYAAAVAKPFQGRLLSDWAENIESDRLTRIINTVRKGYLQGDTNEQIARQVRGTKTHGYKDGAIQVSRANVVSITKTAISHFASVARNKFAENNADILDYKKWLSTLDTKTSTDCRFRDQLKYTLDGKPIDHKIPYLSGPGRIHFCCRSLEILVTKSWRDLGIDIDEMDAGTRASMDGQVPSNTTYGEWLQRQPYQRQVKVLGETRARLMRDGNLRCDEFYSDRGEWLTLEQLRAINEKKFEVAGL